MLTSLLANEAFIAIKPADLPINLTRPMPYSAELASILAEEIALVASYYKFIKELKGYFYLNSSFETKRLINDGNIVINSFGDTTNSDF